MKKVIIKVIAVFALIGLIIGAIIGLEQLQRPDYDKNLQIAFIGTEDDADCTLLWQKDFAMMIDTGEEQDAETILSFLKEHNIHALDYLVLTHPDKDHIGSAAKIIEAITVSTVIEPYYLKENDNYTALQDKFARNNVQTVVPSKELKYHINDMTIRIYPPQEKSYQNDNNYSLGVYITHKDNQLLFMGDAENKRINELSKHNWSDIDLYKVPHHGRFSESSANFFLTIKPTFSVVSAKAADAKIIDAGDNVNTKWYFTRKNTVVFKSDGVDIVVESVEQ